MGGGFFQVALREKKGGERGGGGETGREREAGERGYENGTIRDGEVEKTNKRRVRRQEEKEPKIILQQGKTATGKDKIRAENESGPGHSKQNNNNIREKLCVVKGSGIREARVTAWEDGKTVDQTNRPGESVAGKRIKECRTRCVSRSCRRPSASSLASCSSSLSRCSLLLLATSCDSVLVSFAFAAASSDRSVTT